MSFSQERLFLTLGYTITLLIGCAFYVLWFNDTDVDSEALLITIYSISLILGAIAIILSSSDYGYTASALFCLAFTVQASIMFFGVKFNFYCCSGIISFLLVFCIGSIYEWWNASDKAAFESYEA